jgi:hypothetical protein
MKKTEQEILNYIRGLTLFSHLIGSSNKELIYRDLLQNINDVLDDYFKTDDIKVQEKNKKDFLEQISN